MVGYGPVWSGMVQHCPVWSCIVRMVLYGPVWSRMVPYGPVWLHMVPYVIVQFVPICVGRYGRYALCMKNYNSLRTPYTMGLTFLTLVVKILA